MQKKSIISITLFWIIFLFILYGVTLSLKMTPSELLINKKGLSMEPDNSIDVLLIGNSEVYTGFQPMKAWKEKHFTSFSYGIPGLPGSMYQSMVQEAIEKQDPQLLVIEINGFVNGDAYFEREGKLHNWIDNLSISKNRLQTIRDEIPKEKYRDYVNLLSVYHGNWKYPFGCSTAVLTRFMNIPQKRLSLKGYATTAAMLGNHNYNKRKELKFSSRSAAALQKFLNYCKKRQLKQILFVSFPHANGKENIENERKIKSIIEKNGYQFLNLYTAFEETGIEPSRDFYDVNHLNIFGSEKLTAYLSDYIESHYTIIPNQNQEIQKMWESDARTADQIIKLGMDETLENKNHKRIFEYSLLLEKYVYSSKLQYLIKK